MVKLKLHIITGLLVSQYVYEAGRSKWCYISMLKFNLDASGVICLRGGKI